MDKVKLKRIMAESVFVRETAVKGFLGKLGKKSYSEAKKILKEMDCEDEKDLEEKVMDGDIVAEDLDIKDDDGDLSTETVDEDKTESESTDEEETNIEKVTKILEKLESRLRKVESLKEEVYDDYEQELEEGIEDQDGKSDLDSGSLVDGETEESDIDKDASSGALPEGVDSEGDEMSEMGDDEMSEEEEDEMPQPPIVKESVGLKFTGSKSKESALSSKTLNTLFN